MRKYILILLFINLYTAAYSQLIQGTISDRQTDYAISYAAVYFSGTFVGTTSDQEGNFELDITKYASRPLTISAVGYYSFTLADFSGDAPFKIYLTPYVYEIEEVSVSAESLARNRHINLRLFRKEFLGTSYNARECKIINENDITFNYGSDDDTLKAFALNPIHIHNKTLGYHITYYLDKFEFDKKSKTTSFTGDIIFNQDLAIYETNLRAFERRRRYAYSGSCMHFFRALWSDDLGSNSFTIMNSAGEELKYTNVVIEDNTNRKFLKYPESLDINYFRPEQYYLS